MFQNRAIQVDFIKKDAPSSGTEKTNAFKRMTPEQISTIAKDHLQHAAVVFGAVYAGAKILNTICEITVNAAPKQ